MGGCEPGNSPGMTKKKPWKEKVCLDATGSKDEIVIGSVVYFLCMLCLTLEMISWVSWELKCSIQLCFPSFKQEDPCINSKSESQLLL